MFDVVVVGSANLDLVATTERLPRPGETVLGHDFREHAGGKGLNQAVAAARAGADTALIGALGDDPAGHHLRAVAEEAGVDTTGVAERCDVATGRALITVDARAENSIVVVPGANATVTAVDVPVANVVLAQLEIPIPTVLQMLRAARAAGATTLLNPAPAPSWGLPDELLAVCDIVIPNEHEIELLGGVDSLLDRGVGSVVVTRGAAGVTVTTGASNTELGERVSWAVEAFSVEPIDTTGAGDAFCGALAARLAAGDDLARAVTSAAAAGALATTVVGAVPSLPMARAIDALVATRTGGSSR